VIDLVGEATVFVILNQAVDVSVLVIEDGVWEEHLATFAHLLLRLFWVWNQVAQQPQEVFFSSTFLL
jgi:hypothetical protein